MIRQDELIRLVEHATNGLVASFYEMITTETKAVVNFKDAGYYEIIARNMRKDQRTSLYGDAIAEALYLNNFVASTPIEITKHNGKLVVRGTGQRIHAYDMIDQTDFAQAA